MLYNCLLFFHYCECYSRLFYICSTRVLQIDIKDLPDMYNQPKKTETRSNFDIFHTTGIVVFSIIFLEHEAKE